MDTSTSLLQRDSKSALLIYLPFSLVLNTVIGVMVTALIATWDRLGEIMIYSHCIGLSIFSVSMLLHYTARYLWSWLRSIYVHFAISIPMGGFLGVNIAYALLGSVPGWEPRTDWDWTPAAVFAFIGGITALLFATNLERKRVADQAERTALTAQLRALQAQIEPHFLFNTLATLDALIATDANQARTLLGHLIRYLRAALAHARETDATLASELDLLRSYLAIMRVRLPARLTVDVQCDDDCLALPFPPMLLQPLVENAVTHGIEPASRGGTIAISAGCRNDTLVIEVEDSGAGLRGDHHNGTGLTNVRDRLRALYGNAASLELAARQPSGTLARLSLPLAALSR